MHYVMHPPIYNDSWTFIIHSFSAISTKWTYEVINSNISVRQQNNKSCREAKQSKDDRWSLEAARHYIPNSNIHHMFHAHCKWHVGSYQLVKKTDPPKCNFLKEEQQNEKDNSLLIQDNNMCLCGILVELTWQQRGWWFQSLFCMYVCGYESVCVFVCVWMFLINRQRFFYCDIMPAKK